MRYCRVRLAGGSCFFTVNLAEHSRALRVDHIGILRNAVRAVRQNHPFDILA
jgi:putative transposase